MLRTECPAKPIEEEAMYRLITVTLVALLLFSSCKLKDTSEPGTTDPSTVDAAITVVAPNGGEQLAEGSEYQIKWTGTGTNIVKIQYSIDNGISWGLVVDSLSNTGVFSWFPIPNTISNQCRIRVASVNGSSSDASDNIFSIIKNSNESLRIVSPIGSETWEAGTAKQIKWYSAGLDSVKIEYTTNNGQRWNLIAVDKKNTGIYFWEPVPNTPSTLAKVRIMDAKDGSPSTESTNAFEILPEPIITVLSPDGGETIISGTSRRIDWLSENIENVKISYTTNNGFNWTTIIESTPSTGFYTWNPVPNINSELCKIRIYDAKDGEPNDVSDSVFTVTNLLSKSVKVNYPNGNERWIAGSTQEITWSADGIEAIKIDFTTNSGVTWNPVVASTPNTKSYSWKSIPNITSDKCKIRVSDASDATFYDESDNYYTMTPTPTIAVTTPNGGEYWQSGSNQEIRWVSENIPDVKIEFTSDGGANWSTIINSTPSIGTYTWMGIPNMNSQQCRIKITDANFGSPTDVSDLNFTISNQVNKSIKVLTPNGGENIEAGTKFNITWNSSNVSRVKIELTTNKGSEWNVLANDLTGGAYEWSINETLNSTQCQIRISDATDNNIADISDAVFIISPKKFITVTGPVTRIYKSNVPIVITWLSGGIQKVGIRYTFTNGVADISNPAFVELAEVGAGTGSYTTYFSYPSDKYFVQVYNADEGSNGMPNNNSPGFTVEKAIIPSVTVLSPNGGEQWLGNEPNVAVTDQQKYHPFEIKWHAENTNKVMIEWTTNGGGSWYVVPGADSTANDGIYIWAPGRSDTPVRPDSSDNCRIRISSADKGGIEISDMTDGFFSIHKSKKIKLEFPNNGEDFYPPEDVPPKSDIHWPMAIRWTSYAISGSVDIYYSLQNGADGTWILIANDYPSTGLYPWDFVWGNANGFLGPIEPAWSALGRIKIVDSADNNVWDTNDIPFYLNVKKFSGSQVPGNNQIKLNKKN